MGNQDPDDFTNTGHSRPTPKPAVNDAVVNLDANDVVIIPGIDAVVKKISPDDVVITLGPRIVFRKSPDDVVITLGPDDVVRMLGTNEFVRKPGTDEFVITCINCGNQINKCECVSHHNIQSDGDDFTHGGLSDPVR